ASVLLSFDSTYTHLINGEFNVRHASKIDTANGIPVTTNFCELQPNFAKTHIRHPRGQHPQITQRRRRTVRTGTAGVPPAMSAKRETWVTHTSSQRFAPCGAWRARRPRSQ